MTRSFHLFECEGEQLYGSLDVGSEQTGLLIVSGGNEVRAGAHAGMARLAEGLAGRGFPVFRYDRRGIGESSGKNNEFLSSLLDITAAVQQFQVLCPNLQKIVAFGNCDAATALALFGPSTGIDSYILANPWVIENDNEVQSTSPTPNSAAIRSRYWERLKNPRSIVDLFSGKIDIGKLVKGLKQASKKQENGELSIKLRDALEGLTVRTDILIANRDTTALTFIGSWKSKDYESVRSNQNISVFDIQSASHSFADKESKNWLEARILDALADN